MSRAVKFFPADIEEAAADWIVRRDAGLSAEEARDFDRWRAADPRHAAALARNAETWSKLDRPLQAGQSPALLRQLEQRAVRRRRRRAGIAAAALAVLLVAGFAWRSNEFSWRARVGSPSTAGVLVLPRQQHLSDGSVVELKEGAEITVDFSGPMRRVALIRGEAHFQVAKNKERPFIVSAGGIEVQAVGTAFAVQLGAHTIEVVVTEGTIAVNPAAATAPSVASAPPPTTVTAGNRVVVSLAAAVDATTDAIAAEAPPVVVAMPEAEMAERLAWRVPQLEFSNTPLANAVALINQHNRVQLVIDDATLRDVQITGFFRADNAEKFARLIEPSLNVKAERSGDTILLRKAH